MAIESGRILAANIAAGVINDEPLVRLENVSKNFGATYAVDDLSLNIYRGEFFSLLGPSGCGKTTLLRMLAGFEKPSQGKIYIDGKEVTHIPPYERPINMMFQSYALFPHMNVEDNIGYGLKQENLPKEQIESRVQEMLALVQIEKLARRKPHQLSGGQKQRVALARALAKHPGILLLDEPLGALDKRLREEMQFELVNLQEQLGITFIIVTHDQEEAMTMSTRIGLMNSGRLEQVDAPRRLYEFPATRYAANFIGLINFFEGRVVRQEEDLLFIRCDHCEGEIAVKHSQPLTTGMDVVVAIRPEKILIVPDSANLTNRIKGVIRDIAYLGDVSIYHVELASGMRVKFTQSNIQALAEQPLNWDQEVLLGWQTNSCNVLTQ